MKILSCTIAVGKRYNDLAVIFLQTFEKHHDNAMVIVTDNVKLYRGLNVYAIDIRKPLEKAKKTVNRYEYPLFNISDYEVHDRAICLLTYLIIDNAIKNFKSLYTNVLVLDIDGMFTGNIINRLETDRHLKNYTLIMVERADKRIVCQSNGHRNGGFVLYKIDSQFINEHTELIPKLKDYETDQTINNQLLLMLNAIVINNPFFNFVSPDIKNSKLTDKEIIQFKPAYIHLHGKDALKRQRRFNKIFNKG